MTTHRKRRRRLYAAQEVEALGRQNSNPWEDIRRLAVEMRVECEALARHWERLGMDRWVAGRRASVTLRGG